MFRSGFFTSDSWTVNGDGFVIGNKAEGSDFLAKIVAVAVSDGVPYLPTSNLQVTATTGMILSVGAGFGFKDGYMAWETADTTITCTSSASEQTLYISARLDTTTGEFTGGKVDKYTTFVAATDICFAIVVIPANAVTITSAMITDVRGNATYCGYITDQREYLETLTAWLQNEIANVIAGGMPDHATTHNVGGDDELSFVSYEAQTLTAGEKTQALENIGALPYDATPSSILVNGDWIAPFNQRGTTGAVTNAYCIDCWVGNGTVTPSQGSYTTLANGTTMIQGIEILPAKLLSKTYTAGIKIGNAIQSATLVFPAAVLGAPVSSALTGVTVEIGFKDLGAGTTTPLEGVESRYVPYIKLTATAAINVQEVSLQAGSVCTMAYWAPKKRSVAFAECLRYVWNATNRKQYATLALLLCTSTTAGEGVLTIPVPMRKLPTVTKSGAFTFAGRSCTAISTAAIQATYGGSLYIAASVASGLTAGTVGILRAENDANATLILTAELPMV